MKSGIYSISSPSGSRYIGSAINFSARWRSHRYELRRGIHHNQALQRACDKYGIEGLTFSKVLVCRVEDLLLFEQRALDILKPEYNANPCASSRFGTKHSAESKAKCSAAKKGKKFSEEHRRKMSIARTGKVLSAETKAKISAANSGKKRSVAVRARISEIRTGKPLSETARAKLSAFWTGRPKKPKVSEAVP